MTHACIGKKVISIETSSYNDTITSSCKHNTKLMRPLKKRLKII